MNKRMRAAAVFTLWLIVGNGFVSVATAEALAAGEPCHLVGVVERVTCYEIDVPYDYENPEDDAPVRLNVVVMESLADDPAPEAFVLLAGGPGQAASELGALTQGLLNEIRQRQDVLLLDQRGTGKSESLNCSSYTDIETIAMDPDAFKQRLAECRQSWRQDLTHFGSAEVLRDLDRVRETLGYERLDLWGGSWGTRTALLYLKRYPERVRSAVLDGVAPPNLQIFRHEAQYADAALTATLDACAADDACRKAFPDLETRYRAWLDTFDEPLTTRIYRPDTGSAVDVPVEFTTAVQAIRGMLYSVETAAMVPYVIDEMIGGNLAPLMARAMSWFGPDSGVLHVGLTLSTLCTEDIGRADAALVSSNSANTFVRDSYFQMWRDFCADWPTARLSDDYAEPVISDVPVLLLSGDVDPITASESAEAAVRYLANARHLVAPNTGHIVTQSTCAIDLVTDFVEQRSFDELKTDCLGERGRPAFVTTFNGPQP